MEGERKNNSNPRSATSPSVRADWRAGVGAQCLFAGEHRGRAGAAQGQRWGGMATQVYVWCSRGWRRGGAKGGAERQKHARVRSAFVPSQSNHFAMRMRGRGDRSSSEGMVDREASLRKPLYPDERGRSFLRPLRVALPSPVGLGRRLRIAPPSSPLMRVCAPCPPRGRWRPPPTRCASFSASDGAHQAPRGPGALRALWSWSDGRSRAARSPPRSPRSRETCAQVAPQA